METEKKRYIAPEVLFGLIEEELREGRKASFVVTGMCMWPFICHGRDSVVIEPVTRPASTPDEEKEAPRDLKIGDIVLLKIPHINGSHKYILHRITHIRKEEGLIETTGDGNIYRDGWFPVEYVVARVAEIEYRGRTIDVNSGSQRILSAVWRSLFPVRPGILRLLRGISKVKRRIRR